MDSRSYQVTAVALAAAMATSFVTLLVLFDFPAGTISPDAPGYISVTEYLKGEDVVFSKWRVSRPVIPLLALPLSFWLSIEASFLVVNAMLFVLLVALFFDLAKRFLGSDRQAFYSTILLIFAFPVYYRGINVTPDLASWLIFVATASVLLRLENGGRLTVGACSALSALCALGMLVTEFVLASFLLVFSFYAFASRTRRLRPLLRDLLFIGAAFLVPVLLTQFAIYLFFDYSALDKTRRQLLWFANNPMNLGIPGFVRVLLGAFLASLLFVPIGMLDFRRSMRNQRLMVAMLVSAMLTLFAGYTNSIRFVFVLFPLVFTLSVLGIVRSSRRMSALLASGNRGARASEVAAVWAVCAINVVVYVGFLRYGSTVEMARRFLRFLL